MTKARKKEREEVIHDQKSSMNLPSPLTILDQPVIDGKNQSIKLNSAHYCVLYKKGK